MANITIKLVNIFDTSKLFGKMTTQGRTSLSLKTKKVANIATFMAFPGMDKRKVNFATFLAIIAS